VSKRDARVDNQLRRGYLCRASKRACRGGRPLVDRIDKTLRLNSKPPARRQGTASATDHEQNGGNRGMCASADCKRFSIAPVRSNFGSAPEAALDVRTGAVWRQSGNLMRARVVMPDEAFKIEITPAMIAAGADALAARYFDLVDSYEYPEIAKTVFEAMVAEIGKPLRAIDRTFGSRPECHHTDV
jgi:hypothetical protein